MLLQEQNFGVEIKLTGITRIKAAKTISEYFGTISRYVGTGYDTYAAEDRKGRTCAYRRTADHRKPQRGYSS